MVTAKVFDVDVDDALRQTLDYWRRLCGQRRMPARKDLNPADIPRLLPKLMLAEVANPTAKTGPNSHAGNATASALVQAPQFRFRLVGTEVTGQFGTELTGLRLSEVDYGAQADAVAALYRRVLDCGEPQFARIDFTLGPGLPVQMEHLLLPLSDDGSHVNMILAVLHCQ
ncbi:MAG: PAS domain-containing protein [Rhodospirillaceae bacterium]|jgi:hypothetical protein|nr:PAS domain-containing protein [Rhodospirillaceae bacterium]MBT3781863.1 PAS domain-containing protein [Rhodospirillaceae bacterium]MBT3975356.1 PAS domain-containing protein [Rhodospirillaceae bacterium]MBT4170061.1 PAS domain-containing protein [Rhodospirillaceae bacterium]MBT4562172.1 PAS domain-containing protein [Rhodospirillaceae bacterium]